MLLLHSHYVKPLPLLTQAGELAVNVKPAAAGRPNSTSASAPTAKARPMKLGSGVRAAFPYSALESGRGRSGRCPVRTGGIPSAVEACCGRTATRRSLGFSPLKRARPDASFHQVLSTFNESCGHSRRGNPTTSAAHAKQCNASTHTMSNLCHDIYIGRRAWSDCQAGGRRVPEVYEG